jgi:hypothetical protein
MEAQDLLVTNVDLCLQLLSELCLRLQSSLEIQNVLVISLASFVSFSNFVGPLVLILQDAFLHLEACVHSRSGAKMVLLKQISQFHALLVALQHVCGVSIVKLAEAFYNAVLARSVDFV